MTARLIAEQIEQRRWRLRDRWSGYRYFDRLVHNEFLSFDHQYQLQSDLLSRQLRFAAVHVPHYRESFRSLGIDHAAIRDSGNMHQLPLLRRDDIQANPKAFMAATLPAGETRAGITRTSGSTGQPVVIRQTARSMRMFSLLKQRELRWFRADPQEKYAVIRPASDMPKKPDGTPYGKGETCRESAWHYVGKFFHTGPFVGFIGLNPVEQQIKWLQREQPAYLLALSARLEHLALAFSEIEVPGSLKGLQGVSQTMTSGMRRTVENIFAVPVHENYGLNEIGIVAARCLEGGRYHVHNEHCMVEIVDERGHAVRAGEVGHLLVTSFTNSAMPLIRYDTGDLAEAVDGLCPCGRTLPSFAGLRGRYSRIAFLPPGTLERWAAVEKTIEELPQDLLSTLRQYQVHQSKDKNSLLRVVARTPIRPEFRNKIHAAWDAVDDGLSAELRIEQVEQMPGGLNKKFERFTSEFTPAPGAQGPS